ncbi:hypothetical protein [Mesorhizobium sp. J428]|uniref:hypothetical protein n=1 Tax=Mesorhizobium sp. J428 TaxID=2898440 RepID=UPI0035AE25A3
MAAGIAGHQCRRHQGQRLPDRRAFYAGVGGGLRAYLIRFVGVDQFTLFNSVFFIAMIIVGGMGSVVGALIGVFVIRVIQGDHRNRWAEHCRQRHLPRRRHRLRGNERDPGRGHCPLHDPRAQGTDASLDHPEVVLPHLAVPLLTRAGPQLGERK